MLRATHRFPLLASLVLGTAVPAAGQVVTSQSAARGWIGVSVEIVATHDQDGTRTTATITDVSRGGPADRAGIRPGDVLLSIDGRARFPQNLRAGDSVHVIVRHGDTVRRLTIAAVPRPADVVDEPTLTVTVRADSMADRMYRAMDSVRLRLASGGPASRRVVEIGGFTPLPLPSRDVGLQTWTLSEVRPPFGFYIFRGEAYDSLTRAMNDLNRDIRRLEEERSARLRELTRTPAGDLARVEADDPELQRLHRAVLEADRRAGDLREAMARAARRAPGADFVGPFNPNAADRTVGRVEAMRSRPLDLYLLGQNHAAGAEVVDLRPELAEYFEVEGGVLVIDVPEGTPAALAGIQPGDVLTHVGTMAVFSIQELRQGLAATASEIPVTVVRKGREVHLLLLR